MPLIIGTVYHPYMEVTKVLVFYTYTRSILCLYFVLQYGNPVYYKLTVQGIMSHIFSHSSQRGKISQLNPPCCVGKAILGGIHGYMTHCTLLFVQ